MELDSGRGGGFLEGGYVGNSIRFIDLGVEKDCIIDSLVNGYTCMVFLVFFLLIATIF